MPGTNIAPYVGKEGLLLPLAVFSEEREKEWPAVPTMKELGYNIVQSLWISVFVPKDTPRDRVDFLRGAFAKMVKDKSYLRLLSQMRQPPGFMEGEKFHKVWENDYANAKRLIKEVGGK